MQKPLLSVITVVLNAETTIEKTIESVAEQTYSSMEYIVIDGDSTDGTLNILDKYKSIIAYMESKKDGGIYDAMNRGIEIAKGDVIYFLGADDVLCDINVFSDIMDFYTHNSVEMVYGRVLYKDKKLKNVLWRKGRHIFSWDLRSGRMPSHQSIFMKKQTLLDLGLFKKDQYRLAADFDLLCAFFDAGYRSLYIKRDIAVYSLEGISSRTKDLLHQEMGQIIEKYFGTWAKSWFLFKKNVRKVFRPS